MAAVHETTSRAEQCSMGEKERFGRVVEETRRRGRERVCGWGNRGGGEGTGGTLYLKRNNRMAGLEGKSLAVFLAAVVAAAFLAGGAVAADAPTPSPTSAVGALSPPLAIALLASLAALQIYRSPQP
ncbi:hypothetical protein BHE74_00046741 [Ensete ventricosum]|nr:hypothetical protein BHE74_00046741 [Ensete ventricosum]